LIGFIGRVRVPFSIDFGVGDVIIPSPVERTLPALLTDFEKPKILTYSLESTVAEKLDAIISLMEATSRMKDFFDIYYLATASFAYQIGDYTIVLTAMIKPAFLATKSRQLENGSNNPPFLILVFQKFETPGGRHR
ncbi:MAG TPA: nucleotidyl transferase AbiEii/AbiGii toxin family protein, partial [Clostridia bacterium]|nr:nucleotidyl transferase AbiEii/AbiGii toxin family protein [Clostridia bacterium]